MRFVANEHPHPSEGSRNRGFLHILLLVLAQKKPGRGSQIPHFGVKMGQNRDFDRFGRPGHCLALQALKSVVLARKQ